MNFKFKRLHSHQARSEIFRLHRHLYPMEVARRGGGGDRPADFHWTAFSQQQQHTHHFRRSRLVCLGDERSRHSDPANRWTAGSLHGAEASDAAGYVRRAIHRSDKVFAGFLGDDWSKRYLAYHPEVQKFGVNAGTYITTLIAHIYDYCGIILRPNWKKNGLLYTR